MRYPRRYACRNCSYNEVGIYRARRHEKAYKHETYLKPLRKVRLAY